MSGNFISAPSYFNGFEAIGVAFYSTTTYSEGGITISYSGAPDPAARFIGPDLDPIWTTWTDQIGGQGDHGWYGPGSGYTDVRLTGGGEMNGVQFLAGSGWGYAPDTYMQYQVLLKGAVLSSGSLTISSGNCSTGAWALGDTCSNGDMEYFGFSGGPFDEVRLQDQGIPDSGFNATAFEAGAYDSFAASAASVPEPAMWAMLILGLAWTGATLRANSCGPGRLGRTSRTGNTRSV
jgi:hypothetical protein